MAISLTLIIESSLSGSVSRKLPTAPKPALLMKTSICASASSSRRLRHRASSARSAVMIRHSTLSRSRSACSRSVLRPVRIRLYPSDAKTLANSMPIPEVAPVINAVFMTLSASLRFFSDPL